MVDINQLLKQAQEMQSQIQEKEKEMKNKEFIGLSDHSFVKVICTGKGDIKKIDIDPSILNPENAITVQNYIIQAFGDAKKQAEEIASSAIDNILNIIPKK